MKWDIQTVGFNAKNELLESTKESVMKLEKYFTPIIGAEVYLRLEYDNQNENKKVEVKLNIPGEDVYAEHKSESFEHSLHESIDKVKKQLLKKKDLERAHR
ncbi:MAG: ribosome-associated translation inhibitor RaiA [Salibacteraceae bacterium]|jgi:putative sigma-54 modulation protein|nr:ribosome-associated translation inhibitor RaiA [Salibacteraceae bacterium]MDP4685353.1 ribosome-associated translation inhibitor RaiA [Salibacteraceae bacterium]MDP4764228.1 ribosome-associated translation inhibitor RaiA [Salibacteraceae bacterium]MDP4845534.1 ribosome-associated translation inhibitor RaiA [Salibacteraceae bacterium]MDP4963423.1 ribosome-associated translation inhibitor RaiA [Salibacteraceae bacterium]